MKQPSPKAKISILEGYESSTYSYDELYKSPGKLHDHWAHLVQGLEGLGTAEIQNRKKELTRILTENGVTYSVADDPAGTERVWPLDPIPFLLTSREWGEIERGVIQRAELYNLLLQDLYGERTVIKEKILPASVVFSHPAYFRSLTRGTGFPPFSLDTLSVDVARRIDGKFIAIDDRTEFHLGTGYALENRIAISRVFPSFFRDSSVHRLAPFFRTFRSKLSDVPTSEGTMPRIVLLSPGPGADSFFEHAYLASYLGLTLAQASDLVVQNGMLWLRTLEGLRRVHTLLRRVTDPYADPLELRGDSFIGVPGLVESVRLGNLKVINTPGTGVLQNPAIAYFLPALARHFLGQDLYMPSVIVQWCGDPLGFGYVKENLDRMIIRPLHPSIRPPVAVPNLNAQERRELLAEIEARPHLFVGQETVYPSTAPSWNGERLESRHLILRSFLIHTNDTYTVMPGGLSRISPVGRPLVYSNQKGGAIKDTWILASEPSRQETLLVGEARQLFISREGGEVAGRVADSLYWMGRYAERVDFMARMVRETLERIIDLENPSVRDPASAMIRTLRNQVGLDPSEHPLPGPMAVEKEVLLYLNDVNLIGSLNYNARALDRASRSVRDRVSEDMRKMIRGMISSVENRPVLEDAQEAVDRVLVYSAAFSGLIEESMSRGQGWRFLEGGRRLERALQTLSFLGFVFVDPIRPDEGTILRICDSERTYKRRYLSDIRPNAVYDTLLFDESNPRSVAFQAIRLEKEIRSLFAPDSSRRPDAEKAAIRFSTSLKLTDLSDLFSDNHRYDPSKGEFFERLLEELSAVQNHLFTAFFKEAQKPDWRYLDASIQNRS